MISWRDPQVVQRRTLRLLGRGLTYLVLVDVAFVFLFPLFYMAITSVKSPQDLVDPTVVWVPHGVYWPNFDLAYQSLTYLPALWNSVRIAIPAAILQTIACSFVAYGFARIRFPGREVLFFLVLFTFLVPPQTIVVPLFILYKELGWVNNCTPVCFFLIAPTLLGHGIKGALFILVFRQFYRGLPWELEDAAAIDGAGPLRTYWQIMLPLASPALIVVLLFSLVWHWNDYFMSTTFLSLEPNFTLPMRLSVLWTVLNTITRGGAGEMWNEGLAMAGVLLVVFPLILIYVFTQRYFVESIGRTGLVD